MKAFIDYNKAAYANTINWISDQPITKFKPYISAILCDNGEEYEELWGDDFQLLSLDAFEALDGDEKNQFILCYTADVEVDIEKFPKFKDALDKNNNTVEVKISFLDENQNEVDDEELFEPHSDTPVELQIY